MIELMDGVKVVNTYYVGADDAGYVLTSVLFIVAIVLFAGTIACIRDRSIVGSTICGIATVGCLVLSVLACRGCIRLEEQKYDHPYYQVVLDDSVSLNEFYNTFDVIKNEGQIFTVQVKENE